MSVPKVAPLGQVISTERLEHSFSYSDVSRTTRRAKPCGVTGCQISIAIGEVAPTAPEAYRFVDVATRTPHMAKLAAHDGGKTAHYLLRYVNTKGEASP